MLEFLGNLAAELGDGVFSVAAGLIGWLVGVVADVIITLSAALPDGNIWELPDVIDQWETGLGWLNWWLPIGQFAAVIAAWITATLAYYAFQFILKQMAK